MTVTDYASIRERLDHPQVVVWDPCAPSLTKDEVPEWPTPRDFNDVGAVLTGLPLRVQVRAVLVAAVDSMCEFEQRHPGDARPRNALYHASAWLVREELTTSDLGAVHNEVARAAGEAGGDWLPAACCGGVLAMILFP